jgi:glutamate-ammonia-ligase adenylyltransferase
MMDFPPARDALAAKRLRDAFPEPADEQTNRLLDCLGGNSPYLSDLALREPKILCAILAQGPDAVCDLALSRLTAMPPTLKRAETAALLREAKRHVALAAAIADIGGVWTLDQVTGALSDLADGALRAATSHLLRAAHENGELRLPYPNAPSRGSGFTVLAMGKLGGRELNFSSDVDLVLLYDSGAHPYTAERNGAIFTRLARDLVTLMQGRDANGYVFRTDLRLRPDPGSTPLAIALPAALAYYEGAALTWERAAMIKARPVAGDPALGRRFLDAIRPFIWRRHLDFAALADIRAMKHRMDEAGHAALPPDGTPAQRLLGHNLKLGQGGIREIEFCAQSLQLVWGGRNPALRLPATLPALAAEAESGHVPDCVARKLANAYVFLRTAEHRLQMVADRQTHSLPDTPEGLADFAAFFGYPDVDVFAAKLLRHLTRVHAAFGHMLRCPLDAPDIAEPKPAAGPSPALPPRPSWTSAATRPWEAWLAGRPRALRTERARALLSELLPALQAVVERQPDPQAVWTRLDEFIHRLPAGVQLFSLLQHNPALLDRLGDVLGAAPFLADHLASVPSSLEGLVAPQGADPDPRASLAARLHDAHGIDEALGVASRFVRGEEFRLAVAELDGRLGPDDAGSARSSLAEATIASLLPLVMKDHARRYGKLPGGAMVVVALGKLGSREMMVGSDLDLMLIYDHPDPGAESTGRSKLSVPLYFSRAAQAVVAALTVPTRDGKLYDVDMRLRPSGGKGPVAVSLAAFERYHREDAWTWERLALTRARVVAGPKKLAARVTAAMIRALAQGDREAILSDTAAMRHRLLADLPPQGYWDIKLRRGGLLDVEFIAQALQLLHAGDTSVLHPTTRIALARLAANAIIPRADAIRLIEADEVWRAAQGMLRIALGRSIPKTLPPALEARLLRATDRILVSADGMSLAARLDSIAAYVTAAFSRLVGEVSVHEHA